MSKRWSRVDNEGVAEPSSFAAHCPALSIVQRNKRPASKDNPLKTMKIYKNSIKIPEKLINSDDWMEAERNYSLVNWAECKSSETAIETT